MDEHNVTEILETLREEIRGDIVTADLAEPIKGYEHLELEMTNAVLKMLDGALERTIGRIKDGSYWIRE